VRRRGGRIEVEVVNAEEEIAMSKLPAQHRPRSFLPEFGDLLAGFPMWPNLRPMFEGHIIRLEDEMKDDAYVVRAEIPGVDPKDVDITVRDGHLTIKAERTEKKESNGHSEFSYGSFLRSVSLPAGADDDAIAASYDKGILTVSVPVSADRHVDKHVEVTTAG
jgi:HSP20 family molecular chaperone IbpA